MSIPAASLDTSPGCAHRTNTSPSLTAGAFCCLKMVGYNLIQANHHIGLAVS